MVTYWVTPCAMRGRKSLFHRYQDALQVCQTDIELSRVNTLALQESEAIPWLRLHQETQRTFCDT
jgi:hypothetical protein